MNVPIREYTRYKECEILPLYQSVGWKAYTDAPATLARAFSKSLIVLGAYSGETLIGLVRAVGDGETIVFIQDLLMHPEYQRNGVSSALVYQVLNQFRHVRQIQLTTDNTPETIAFYSSLFFQTHTDFDCIGFMFSSSRQFYQ